jgi:iron complex outermembrane receptor protein
MRFATKTIFQRHFLSSLLLSLPCLTATAVHAQSSPPENSSGQLVLEEVIVTARKRAEVLQDTPIAISAFSAEALKIAGIANTRDLEQSVPGLNFSEMGNKSPSIFIRGVGQKESTTALDPGVGVYINSIYIPRTDSQLLDIMDTESIQVLRGPQGTLFGKNNYDGPGGACYAGPGGAAYNGPGGPCYEGAGGACYSGPGGTGENCPSVCR